MPDKILAVDDNKEFCQNGRILWNLRVMKLQLLMTVFMP